MLMMTRYAKLKAMYVLPTLIKFMYTQSEDFHAYDFASYTITVTVHLTKDSKKHGHYC